jgi:hypothetical protein
MCWLGSNLEVARTLPSHPAPAFNEELRVCRGFSDPACVGPRLKSVLLSNGRIGFAPISYCCEEVIQSHEH